MIRRETTVVGSLQASIVFKRKSILNRRGNVSKIRQRSNSEPENFSRYSKITQLARVTAGHIKERRHKPQTKTNTADFKTQLCLMDSSTPVKGRNRLSLCYGVSNPEGR
jgi:hypothetical protein